MIKIDLVTGFLGAGKTTFLRKYAEWLVAQGYQVGIIENDFGTVNVDVLMLQDLLGDRIDVEQIVGGSVVTDWKRRFRTKLISMAMRGFNRILVEPSGIYDVDAFFDVLNDDPIDTWYEAGSVITILDATADENMSAQEEYLMVSQSANAGLVLLSKVQDADQDSIDAVINQLNLAMEKYHCPRRFALPGADAPAKDGTDANAKDIADVSAKDGAGAKAVAPSHVLCKPWDALTADDFGTIADCGYVRADHEKLWFDPQKAFSSLFFMHAHLTKEALEHALDQLFSADDVGLVFRVKGYLPMPEGDWLSVNATQGKRIFQRVPLGQEILIVIGQDLQESKLRPYFLP